ncbi:MAG: tetratricopeptide repeat protein [Fibrella sp.]|nr:tetratricopeptide repeat protein [Armatimonadota bacterium]
MNRFPFRRCAFVAFTTLVFLLGCPVSAQRDAAELKADAALEEKKYVPAITMYTSMIVKTPRRFVLYLKRGIAYYHVGNYDKAARDFTAFIKLRPALVEGYVNRAYAYEKTGQYKEALADLEKADSLNPALKNRELRERLLSATQ